MRINDKLEEIEKYLNELEEIKPGSFKEYITDIKTKAACERYFEKITEAVVDLAFLVIKEKHLKTPEEEKQSFEILHEAKIISEELSIKLKNAKGMRNIIAHKYGTVDDKIVFESITEELLRDVSEFVKNIKTL